MLSYEDTFIVCDQGLQKEQGVLLTHGPQLLLQTDAFQGQFFIVLRMPTCWRRLSNLIYGASARAKFLPTAPGTLLAVFGIALQDILGTLPCPNGASVLCSLGTSTD